MDHRFPILCLLLPLLAGGGVRSPLADSGGIRIEGSSTLHAWECTAAAFSGRVEGGGDPSSLRRVEVVVPVADIGCGNGQMDRKLSAALDAPAHPRIVCVLTEIEAVGAGPFRVQARGTLRVAGVERPQTVPAEGTVLPDGRVRFRGAVPLSMAAFGIKPPSAVLGTIRTGDAVVVRFDVVADLRTGHLSGQ